MDTPPLAGQTLLLTRQRHEADRAGLHWDYRIVAGDKAYSWATKKPMPGPGSAIILHEQPVHTSHYALSKEVVIPPGEYGAGKTTLDFVRKVTVGDHADNDHMTLHLKSGDRYLLKKLDAEKYGEKAWLFKNLAPYKEHENSRLQHNGKRYTVNKLLEQTRTVPTTSFKTEDLKWILDPEQVKQVNLDPERVEAANLRAPLLVGTYQGRPVVLDGAHRLAKAVRDGVGKLPGKLVTEEHLRNSVWEKKAEAPTTEGIEKVALNALKARAMAHAAGIIPDAQWKYALRQVRDGRGNLLPPKELKQAKIKMGDVSNNGFQKIRSLGNKLPPRTEMSGRLESGYPKDVHAGESRERKISYSKTDNFHTHPGAFRNMPGKGNSHRRKFEYKIAMPSGYRQLKERVEGDMKLFSSPSLHKKIQTIVAPSVNTVSSTRVSFKDPNPHNQRYTPSTRLIYFDHTPRLAKHAEQTPDPRFTPDLTPEQMQALGVLVHKGSQYNDGDAKIGNFFGVSASLKTWPDKWHNEQHPQGWYQWYKGYAAGKRTDDDERQIKRWISFKARHLGQLRKADPTLNDLSVQPKRRQALLNWGIAPGIDIKKEMKNKMKTNKYLEKVAGIMAASIPLAAGLSAVGVANYKHKKENKIRTDLDLPIEKVSIPRGASTLIGSGAGAVVGAGAGSILGGIGAAILAQKLHKDPSMAIAKAWKYAPATVIPGTLMGSAAGSYVGAHAGNAAYRGLFNESVNEALYKQLAKKN